MFGQSNGGSNGSRGLASYPAAPHGMLFDDSRGLNKRAAAKWAVAEQRLSAACLALGALILVLSTCYLYHLTELNGSLLGGLLVASGAIGWLGGRSRSANLTNLQLVACLVGTLIAFSLVSEVVRDTQVDCALAELYARGKATEQALVAVETEELHTALFRRLAEMEDSLSLVQQGAAKAVEAKQAQLELKNTDLNYIRHKVDVLKRHAQELLDSVLKNEDVTVERIQRLTEEEKALLRRRMEVADSIIDRINKHHENADAELSFQEYQEILQALTDVDVVPAQKAASPELHQAKQELPNMKAAMARTEKDAYHTLQVGDAPRELHRINAAREAKRQQFQQQFQQLLAKKESHGQPDYAAELPEHCVRETAGERTMVAAALSAVALQAATAYVALSLSFRLPTSKASVL